VDALTRRDAFCASKRTPALLLFALYLGAIFGEPLDRWIRKTAGSRPGGSRIMTPAA
jgi:hypothetical protein